ncbi:MAG: methylated-DNA--[protein]-cysteine S-methyltransferase [Spirochaetaceae bacterium]|nr:methylated-DNA--[protein]-cysteine S-methyltransferase [Spirochaetaceae bacterium]
MTENFYYKSPIEILEIELEHNIVLGLRVVESCSKISERTGYFAEVAKQLDEYFAGKRTKFELNILPKGTEFQKKVWAELLKIPYGKTKSYQEIAEAIGNTNAQRAVGSACNKNPILLIIPCHRVVSKTGKLTGFACGVDKKDQLLKLEANQYFQDNL